MQFANVLRKKRKELHLTQQQLADKLHVTRQTLSRWENNLSYPNLDTLVNLSEFLAVPLDILRSLKKCIAMFLLAVCLALI